MVERMVVASNGYKKRTKWCVDFTNVFTITIRDGRGGSSCVGAAVCGGRPWWRRQEDGRRSVSRVLVTYQK